MENAVTKAESGMPIVKSAWKKEEERSKKAEFQIKDITALTKGEANISKPEIRDAGLKNYLLTGILVHIDNLRLNLGLWEAKQDLKLRSFCQECVSTMNV